MKIRQKNNRILAFALALVLCLIAIGPSVNQIYAASKTPAKTGIGVTQDIHVEGPYAKPQIPVPYLLTRRNADAPMPEGSKGGSYSFSLKSEESKSIHISFTKPGTYNYRIAPDRENFPENFDQEIDEFYDIQITVKEGPNGLKATSKYRFNKGGKYYKWETGESVEFDIDFTPYVLFIFKYTDLNGNEVIWKSFKKLKVGDSFIVPDGPKIRCLKFLYWESGGSRYYPGDRYYVTEEDIQRGYHIFNAVFVNVCPTEDPGGQDSDQEPPNKCPIDDHSQGRQEQTGQAKPGDQKPGGKSPTTGDIAFMAWIFLNLVALTLIIYLRTKEDRCE